MSRVSELRDWIVEKILPVWASVGWDERERQFVEALDLSRQPLHDMPRRLIVQTRQIFAYGIAEQRGWFEGAGALATAAADETIKRYQSPDGEPGWAFSLNRDGSIVDATRDLYSHAFILLALSIVYRQSGNETCLKAAKDTLSFMDGRMAHPAGGYIEQLPATDKPRRQNPHMHLFEALLSWHESAPTEGFLDRAAKICQLFKTRFAQVSTENGHHALVEYFDDGLNPLGGPNWHFEPGHHFEWVWLLGEYARLTDTPLHPLAQELWNTALLLGCDDTGMVFDEVATSGVVVAGGSRTWPLTEALKAFQVGLPVPDGSRLKSADDVCACMLDRFLYPAPGGIWHDQFSADGKLVRDHAPASTLYHLLCAVDQSTPG